jgi:hypothetical protein
MSNTRKITYYGKLDSSDNSVRFGNSYADGQITPNIIRNTIIPGLEVIEIDNYTVGASFLSPLTDPCTLTIDYTFDKANTSYQVKADITIIINNISGRRTKMMSYICSIRTSSPVIIGSIMNDVYTEASFDIILPIKNIIASFNNATRKLSFVATPAESITNGSIDIFCDMNIRSFVYTT